MPATCARYRTGVSGSDQAGERPDRPHPPAWLDRLATFAWPGYPTRWRDVPGRVLPTALSILRLTTGAVVAYLLTLILTEGKVDLTGALTALLVMQASAYSTLKMGAVRVGAVLVGVLVASLLSTWTGLTWWSLGAAIAASLLLGKIFRLGEQALETPISAMLILGLSNFEIAAQTRVFTTLIGAGVGMVFNLLYPPAMPTRPAGRAVLRVADGLGASLHVAGDALAAGPVTREQTDQWLDRMRISARRVADAGDSIAALKDSRRLNPRAIATFDVEPVLATGLVTLEQSMLAIRSLFVVLRTEIPVDNPIEEDPYGEELRQAFAVVLHDAGDCVRAFGDLVVAEAEDRELDTERALADSLEIFRETQAVLTELIMVDAQSNTSSWLLRGSILAALEHVLAQLNLEDRARIHRRWREEQLSRPMNQLPPIITGVLPHPDRPYLRGFRPVRPTPRPPTGDAGSAQ
jgi:hypothetical protein